MAAPIETGPSKFKSLGVTNFTLQPIVASVGPYSLYTRLAGALSSHVFTSAHESCSPPKIRASQFHAEPRLVADPVSRRKWDGVNFRNETCSCSSSKRRTAPNPFSDEMTSMRIPSRSGQKIDVRDRSNATEVCRTATPCGLKP